MPTKQQKEIVDMEVDPMKYLFLEAFEKLTPETEALQNNLTTVFWDTQQIKMERGEIVSIAIRGEPGTGKSTIAWTIKERGNKILTQIKKNPLAQKESRNYVVSDQTEFLRFTDKDLRNIMVMIDEFNVLAKTGLNATTEMAMLEQYNDFFRAHYLHRVTCSISQITDQNSTIILDVLGRNDKTRETRCKLAYRDPITGMHAVIGYVDISVADTIKVWDKEAKKLIEGKTSWTPQEIRRIEELREADGYVAYQIKKHKRLSLINQHGIRDIRELEYAPIILDSLEELQKLATLETVQMDMAQLVIDEVRRRHKRIYSTMTLLELAGRVKAILTMYTKIQRYHTKAESIKITEDQKKAYLQVIEDLTEMLKRRMQEQQNLKKLYDEYNKIM